MSQPRLTQISNLKYNTSLSQQTSDRRMNWLFNIVAFGMIAGLIASLVDRYNTQQLRRRKNIK